MGNEILPAADIFAERDSGVKTVLLRTADDGNRRQLTKRFAEKDAYDFVARDIRTGEFDCYLLDLAARLDNQDDILIVASGPIEGDLLTIDFDACVLDERGDEN